MLERENEKWEQDIEWVMALLTIGQGFKSYHPATSPRFFWRTRELSTIFVERVWPGADYK